MKNVAEMTEDELKKFLTNRGFLEDEIRLNFPTDHDLREAVRDIQKLGDEDADAEEAIGWDSTDGSKLSPEHQAQLDNERKHKEAREKRLKEIQAKKGDLAVTKSIQETGADVTPDEVKTARADILKLLSEADDD